ncbi:unnamed protein product [Durusdinium trenchii]|uniref:Hexosyltransferase n=1 Tax=Durusdinium trenchii TaxID=1381693 RepID=A0ABP0LQD6_9DINO
MSQHSEGEAEQSQPLIKPGPTQGSVGSAGCCWVALTGISVLVLVLIAAVVVLNYTGHTDWVDLGLADAGVGVEKAREGAATVGSYVASRSSEFLKPQQKPSLFCWSLIQAGSGEEDLIRQHRERNTGIFRCDDWLLLSDHPVSFQDVKSMSIGAFNSKRAPWNSWQEPKMAASAFEYLMICQVVESHRTVRGEQSSEKVMKLNRYNVPVFLRAWKQVVDEDQRFQQYDWTVKVDADTFFCHDRLRQRLVNTNSSEAYIWLNYDAAANPGPLDFLGPIEIFSKKAVQLYQQKHWQVCPRPHPQTQGEDAFMKDCFLNLGANTKTDYSILENACDWCKPLSPEQCADSQHVAFHPFKDVKIYAECLEHAANAASC